MRRILHACWPLAAVVMFTVALALQIPRKALFFRPVKLERSVPYASFVEFGESEYAAIMQKVRMSWQVRSHGAGAYAESPIGALDPDDEPPPAPLDLFYFAVTVEMGDCDGKFTRNQRHRLTGKRVKGQNRIFRISAVFQKIKLLLEEKFHTLLL